MRMRITTMIVRTTILTIPRTMRGTYTTVKSSFMLFKYKLMAEENTPERGTNSNLVKLLR